MQLEIVDHDYVYPGHVGCPGCGAAIAMRFVLKALEELRPYLDHDAGLIGYLLVSGALERTESRGAHTRTDFPTTADPRHTVVSATLLKGRAA